MYIVNIKGLVWMVLQLIVFHIENNANCQQIAVFYSTETWMIKPESSKNPLTLYSSGNSSNLRFSCTYEHDLKWEFSGVNIPLNLVKPTPPSRHAQLSKYALELLLRFSWIKKEDNVVVSMELGCYSLEPLKLLDKVHILYSNQVASPLLVDSAHTMVDSKLIPCLTTDPTKDVFLYKKSNNSLVRQFLPYNPTQGFISTHNFDGTYECQQGNLSLTLEATTSQITDPNLFSNRITVKAFTHDKIQLECALQRNTVRILVDSNSTLNKNLNITYTNTENSYIAQLSLHSDITRMKGTAVCEANLNTSSKPTVIKSWSFEFIEEPVLLVDNTNLQLECKSPYKNPVIIFFACRNIFECSILSQICFKNVAKCEKETQETYRSSAFYECSDTDKSLYCVRLRYRYLSSFDAYSGIVQCTVEGLEKRWPVVELLKNKKYIYWREAQNEELIRFKGVKSTYFTNKTSKFVCEVAEVLVDTPIFLTIVYKNRQSELLFHNGDTVNKTYTEEKPYTKNLNIVVTLHIRLPLDTVQIVCAAYMWNSTEMLLASTEFETRHLLAPTSDSDALQFEKYGCTENLKYRLICKAKGYPLPKFTWYYNKTYALKVFSGLQIYTTSNETSYLEFPATDFKNGLNYTGHYKCVAKNSHGSVTQHGFFDFDASSPNSGSQNSIKYSEAYFTLILLCISLIFPEYYPHIYLTNKIN